MDDARPSMPVYDVPYLRLFPWLRLFRCPGSAADPKRLMLAAVGIVLLQAGWAGLDRVFPTAYITPEKIGWLGNLDLFRAEHAVLSSEFEGMRIWTNSPWESFVEGDWRSRFWRIVEPAWCLTMPFLTAFDPTTSARPFLHAVLAGLWALVVWGLIGGAIARIAVVDLARGDRVGLVEALKFSARKAGSLLGTPLVPLLGVVVVAAPVALLGLLYRLPGTWGSTLAGVLAFLPLIGGLLLTLIVVGLAAGWPLMHASVAAEAEDGFDAMSRAYAYVHQRPWHYAAYVAVAIVAGLAGLFFVELFAGLVVRLSAWALAFGGSSATVQAYYLVPSRPPIVMTEPRLPHAFWLGVVALLARGWVYSYFWTTATAVYLLLRRDVDGTPWGIIAYQGVSSPLSEAAGSVPAPLPPTVPVPQTAGLRDPEDPNGV